MWQNFCLGNIAKVSAGNSAPQDKELFVNGNYPFVRTSDVGKIKKGIIFKTNDKLNKKGISKLRLFSKGTVLFPKSGASTLLNHRVMLGIDAYVSSHLATIKSDNSKLLDSYLFYFLQTIDAAKLIQDMAYPSLQTKIISEIKISLPSLAEQQRIVAKLDATFAKINTAKSFTKINQKNVEIFKQTTLSNYLKEKIEDVLFLSKVITKTETVNPKNKPDDSFVYIDISSVDRKTFAISKVQNLLGKNAPSRARRLVRENDIIFATVRPTLKRIALVTNEYNEQVCSTGYFVLRANKEMLLTKYLFYFMQSNEVLSIMEKNQTGASYPAVTDKQIKDISIGLPSLQSQEKIVKKIEQIFLQINILQTNLKKTLSNYQSLRNKILEDKLKNKAV